MRAIVDLLDNMTNTLRVIVGLFVLCVFAFGIFASFGISYAAPVAIEGMAEKAIEANERQMEAALEANRDRELAKEGWGYGSADKPSKQHGRSQDRKDGWGGE